MKQYDPDDVITCYFIVMEDSGRRIIKAWSDNKNFAKFYMDFHKCDSFTMKAITKKARDLIDIINENTNDEIMIARLKIRNPDRSKKHPTKTVEVPITETEHALIRESLGDLMGLRVDYSFLRDVLPYLKGYYRKGLEMLMLPEAIKQAVYNKPGQMWKDCEYDELIMLFVSNPEMFGA